MNDTPLFNTDWPERCPKCNEFFPTIIVGGVAGCIRCDDLYPTVHPPVAEARSIAPGRISPAGASGAETPGERQVSCARPAVTSTGSTP